MLRAISIGTAVDSCVEAFKANYAAIMSGSFSEALAECGPLGHLFAHMKSISNERVFTARRKTELEVYGRRVIDNVMTGILPVYEDLARNQWDAEKLDAHSKQLVRALELDLRDVFDAPSALHALADFTSGMTDRYAVRISKMLSGA